MIRVELPNGDIVEFPDGTPADKIDEVVQRDFAHLKQEPSGRGPFQVQRALGEGALDALAGIPEMVGQIAAYGLNRLVPESDAARWVTEKADQFTDLNLAREQATDKAYEGAPLLQGARMVGSIAPALASPTSRAASIARQPIKRIAQDTAMDVAQSPVHGLLASRPEEITGEQVAEDMAWGTAGLPLRGLTEALTGLQKSAPAAARRVFPMSDEARAADEFAQSRGVPVMGEDLIQNPLIRGSGRLLDYADPLNTRGKQLSTMQEKFRDELLDPFVVSEDAMSDMSDSFRRQYEAVQQQKTRLYDAAWEELNPLGAMETTQFRTRLGELLQDADRVHGAGSKQSREIRKWLEFTDDDVETWHKRRVDLGKRQRAAERGTDPDVSMGQALGDIKKALDTAIDDFGGQSNAYRRANSFYREEVLPYKQDAFLKLARNDDLEKMSLDALATSPTARTQKRFNQVWKGLDDEGRQAYRQRLIETVIEKATDNEVGFSPQRASTMLKNLDNRLGTEVLGPEMRAALEGWQNLFEVSGFAGEQVARSRTGSSIPQLIGPATAVASGFIMPPALLALVPAAAVRSRKVRDILTKISRMTPDHPDWAVVINDLTSELARTQPYLREE